jgi:Tol biopolymer transport system component
LVSGPVGAQDKEGIYIISVIGGTIHKIRDDAYSASISADGSQVVFLEHGGKEIWEMTPDGEAAHQVVPRADEGAHYSLPMWSPDGQRFSYLEFRQSAGNFAVKLLSRAAAGGDPVTVLDNPNLREFIYMPGNRILFKLRETDPNPEDANLWQIRVDPATGKPDGQPRRLTDWSGFSFDWLSASADGKKLAFLNDPGQSDVMVGQLEKNGKALISPTRLTLSDRIDWPGSWTRDGKSFLFYSDRSGRFDVYRQALDERTAQPLGTAPEEKRMPQLSPDGDWIVYISWPVTKDLSAPPGGHVMRIPAGGGPPVPVFAVKGYAVNDAPGSVTHNLLGFPDFRCPSRPGEPCVLAEQDDAKKQIVFTAFDPAAGKKNVVATVPLPVDEWTLSPDGSRIATSSYSFQQSIIHVAPTNGGQARDITVKDWIRLMSLTWAADGNSLFASSDSSRGSTLLHIEMNGDAQPLLRNGDDFFLLTASPDGRHLAFGAVQYNSNAWIIPDVPKP